VSRSRVTLPMERNARETASRSPSPPRISALPTSLVTVAGQSRRDCIVQPRVARHELPWEDHVKSAPTPTGLHRRCPRVDTTPLGLTGHSNILTQGSSCLATLGLRIESLRDSRVSCLELWVMLSPRRGRGCRRRERGWFMGAKRARVRGVLSRSADIPVRPGVDSCFVADKNVRAPITKADRPGTRQDTLL